MGDQTHALVAFQVTSRTDAAKVIRKLKTVVKNGYEKIFTRGIKFLILKNETVPFKTAKTDPKKVLATFDPATDILYPADLIREIKKIYQADYARFLQIKILIEREIKFPSPPVPDPLTVFGPVMESLQQKLNALYDLGKSTISTAPDIVMDAVLSGQYLF